MKKWSVLLILSVFMSVPGLARQYVICIDPGHGAKDPGAEGCGLQEKNVVLSVGLKLRDILKSDPAFHPIMTRSTDVFIPLSGRTDYANSHNADRFVSIHANSDSGKASGIETYCYGGGSSTSFDQRDKIQAEMLDAWPLPSRGGKTANFYVIHHSHMPATLTELAFVDYCAKDAKYLGSDSHRQEAAQAHYLALRDSLGLGGPPAGGKGVLRGVVYEDQGSGASDMSRRLPGATVNIKGGSTDQDVIAASGDASWKADLNAGAYTVTASLSGYTPAGMECKVTANNTTWCSIGLKPKVTNQKGSLKGVVYEDKGDGLMDTKLGGALVHLMGSGKDLQTISAAGSGSWAFNIEPGSYVVEASLSGYKANSRSCAVTVNSTKWCSIGLEKNTPPPPEKGNIKGLIYDLTDGTDSRLRGADITLDGQGKHLTTASSQMDGGFGFQGLPIGDYTLVAGMNGYFDGTRHCVVESGLTAWCSIGLNPVSGGTDAYIRDAYTPPTDPGSNPDSTQPDLWQIPDNGWTADQGTGNKKDVYIADPGNTMSDIRDAGMPDTPKVALDSRVPGNDNGAMVIDIRQDAGNNTPGPGNGGGCMTGQGNTGIPWILGLIFVALLGFRVKKRRFLAILTIIIGLGCQQPQQRAGIRRALVPAQAIEVCNQRVVSKADDWAMPVIAPDGRSVAVTNKRMNELTVINIADGKSRKVATGRGVGRYARWLPDSMGIAVRAPNQTTAAVPIRSVLMDGRAGPVPQAAGVQLIVKDDRVFVPKTDGLKQISPTNDRYCCVVYAPSAPKAAFLGLSTGLHVYDGTTGRVIDLGMGNHPSFSADGNKIVFDRCTDNGDELTGCRLMIAIIRNGHAREYPLKTTAKMPRRPTITPDGKTIAFMADGRIWTGSLNCGQVHK